MHTHRIHNTERRPKGGGRRSQMTKTQKLMTDFFKLLLQCLLLSKSPMNDNCGVFAAYDLEKRRNVTPEVINGLLDLQHRGQLSAGISSFQETRDSLLKTYKKNGLVNEVFALLDAEYYRAISKDMQGTACIGHTRYATSGSLNTELAQPFEYRHSIPSKWFSFCFNGNLANYENLKTQLTAEGHHLKHHVDTEILMHHLAKALKGGQVPLPEVFRYLQQEIDGACNIAFLNGNGDFAAYRDQHGIRPLCYAVHDRILYVSSEDYGLRNLTDNIHSIKPGEMISVVGDHKTVQLEQVAEPKPAHCYFEWVYFSNTASSIDDIPVYLARIKFGEELAAIEDQPLDDECVVVAVPDSARAAGQGFSKATGIEQGEGILKNRYAQRTFIEGHADRERKVAEKYSYIRQVLDGKKVFLVEDSLARATTFKFLVQALRAHASPKEIHLRVACPPIFAPCFYGIDIPNERELFAPKFHESLTSGVLPPEVLKKMAEVLNVDSIKFLPVESLVKAIGLEANKLCMACINRQYPTPAGIQNYAMQKQ